LEFTTPKTLPLVRVRRRPRPLATVVQSSSYIRANDAAGVVDSSQLHDFNAWPDFADL
jgi:hypothetical protein